MNIKFYRIFLFIFGCITSRIGLVLLSANINKEYLPYFGFLTLIPALGFSVIYFFKLRKTGLEVFGDKIWWNSLRPIHSLLYFIFSIMAFYKNINAYKVLLLDVLIGIIAFLYYHLTY